MPISKLLAHAAATMLLAAIAFATGCSDGADTPGVDTPGVDTPGVDTPDTQPVAADRNLPTTVEAAPGLPDYNLYRPADLAATGAPLPVIVWTAGGCVRFDAVWLPLFERWAQGGFVTIAPTVPGDGSDPRNPVSVEEQAAAIDWIHAENARADSPYAGRFDLERIVAAGNSCGGIVSLNLASRDSRVASVFVLSGSSAIPGSPEAIAAAVMGNILVPVGYAVGGPEDIARQFARKDYELLPVGVPGYIAERAAGDHPTVSTDPAMLAEVAEISTNWIDFTLYGNPELVPVLTAKPCATCPPGTWGIQAKHLE